MPLSWNEIKSRAAKFTNEWKDTVREEADAKPFLIEFLDIFGISRKRVATFEHRVKKINDTSGYIDLLWPGTLLVEMKSRGQDLNKAYLQAQAYCHGLKDYELPRIILISDFHHFHVYREDGMVIKFELPQLLNNLEIFEDLAGYQKREYHEQDPVNIHAAELMGKLHDQLKAVGYTGTALEVYLVRLVFILFADDTTIFQKGIFLDYLEQRTSEDGSDLAMHIDQLFQVLDTPEDKRLITLDEQLNYFPYVNGRLFSVRLPNAAFNSEMRKILLDCCKLDWGKISPAIFGSLFQSVMDAAARRNLGAHYTSEKNIMKLIKPLFLDELWEDFHAAGNNHNKLKQLHLRISKLRFLDPACGCGNFLIMAYRELRLLEIAIVEKLLKGQMIININQYFLIDLSQFYGIELDEFASHIAQVAMFLIDHQMNMMASDLFGEYIPLIPLQQSAVIVNGNALSLEWQSLIHPLQGEVGNTTFQYILGNPPFVGSRIMTKEQKEEVKDIFNNTKGAGELDYVTCWYKKAAQYTNIFNETKVAFVSTNSITQGNQVGFLWPIIFSYGVQINFAHKTFKWSNEAKGVAAVYVVIIGFGKADNSVKKLYTYEKVDGEPIQGQVKNINPYLVEGNNLIIGSRQKPICKVPEMNFGNMPAEGGQFLFTEEEKIQFVKDEPDSQTYFKELISAHEFLNGKTRWCLWLEDINPAELKKLPRVYERVQKVREIRLLSSRPFLADTPTVFAQITQPKGKPVLVIPAHSSENRKIIPMGLFGPEYKVHNSCLCIGDATIYHFGILQSSIHMSWVGYTCGRLESRYRYSKDIVYNNFPWPLNPTENQVQAIEDAAQSVLDARAQFPDSSLADLYDPNTMPPVLVKAHQQLDKAVDQCYRSQPFTTEAKRIEYLFELYEKYTAGLFVKEKKRK